MANVIIVKWGVLPTYLPYSTTFLPTYRPTYVPKRYLLQPIYLLTTLGIQHILFNQMDKF
jgi:hypothetical protein